jgi:hypothetical protein
MVTEALSETKRGVERVAVEAVSLDLCEVPFRQAEKVGKLAHVEGWLSG